MDNPNQYALLGTPSDPQYDQWHAIHAPLYEVLEFLWRMHRYFGWLARPFGCSFAALAEMMQMQLEHHRKVSLHQNEIFQEYHTILTHLEGKMAEPRVCPECRKLQRDERLKEGLEKAASERNSLIQPRTPLEKANAVAFFYGGVLPPAYAEMMENERDNKPD